MTCGAVIPVCACAVWRQLRSPEPSSTTRMAVTRRLPRPLESTVIVGVPAPVRMRAEGGLTVHV
jgi:hypothetical protein